MEKLTFSYNWNNKLNCNSFSTIRIYNPAKHFIGNKLTVQAKGFDNFNVEIVGVTPFYLSMLNDSMAYIDTAYNSAKCTDIIMSMYKNTKVDFTKSKLVFVILKKI